MFQVHLAQVKKKHKMQQTRLALCNRVTEYAQK